MEKVMQNETEQTSWNPQEAYESVNNTINNEWPDWKKKAYNEMFAISAHAQKVAVGK